MIKVEPIIYNDARKSMYSCSNPGCTGTAKVKISIGTWTIDLCTADARDVIMGTVDVLCDLALVPKG
jgi:hypothetical protein